MLMATEPFQHDSYSHVKDKIAKPDEDDDGDNGTISDEDLSSQKRRNMPPPPPQRQYSTGSMPASAVAHEYQKHSQYYQANNSRSVNHLTDDEGSGSHNLNADVPHKHANSGYRGQQHMAKLPMSRSMENIPGAFPTSFAAPRGLGLRQYCCVYPGCFSDRVNKRNNIERHVWTQHVRHNLEMSEARYFARSFKKCVDPYVREVPTRAQQQHQQIQNQTQANQTVPGLSLDAQVRHVQHFKTEVQQGRHDHGSHGAIYGASHGHGYKSLESSISYPNSRGASPRSSASYTPDAVASPTLSYNQQEYVSKRPPQQHRNAYGRAMNPEDGRNNPSANVYSYSYDTISSAPGFTSIAPGAGIVPSPLASPGSTRKGHPFLFENAPTGNGTRGNLLEVSRVAMSHRNMVNSSSLHARQPTKLSYRASSSTPQSPNHRWIDGNDARSRTSASQFAPVRRSSADISVHDREMLSSQLKEQLRLVQYTREDDQNNASARVDEPPSSVNSIAQHTESIENAQHFDATDNNNALESASVIQPTEQKKTQLAPLLAALRAMQEMPDGDIELHQERRSNGAGTVPFRPW